jgi:hypothetical protein
MPLLGTHIGVTYGDFANGTARHVFMPRVIHIQEAQNRAAVTEAVDWMRRTLGPSDELWFQPSRQT